MDCEQYEYDIIDDAQECEISKTINLSNDPPIVICFLRLSVGEPNPRVYTRAHEWSRTHAKYPVVHVSVRWITETRKDPACTFLTGG